MNKNKVKKLKSVRKSDTKRVIKTRKLKMQALHQKIRIERNIKIKDRENIINKATV